MKLGHSADEIRYDATYGTSARYLVILDGEPTMAIYADSADSEKVIKVATVDDAHVLETLGRFTMTDIVTEDPQGMPLGVETRVDEKSVYTYVVPRLHVLLGRLLRAA